MIPVSIPELPIIYPLVQECIREKGMEPRLTPDRALDKAHALLQGGLTTILVDDLLLPKILIVLQTGHGLLFDEVSCNVFLIYIPKEHRTPARASEALGAIEAHAREKGAKVVTASSWLYQGSSGIGALWERAGFVQQEIVYVKKLT